MNDVLTEIIRSNKVQDEKGEILELSSSIDEQEILFLSRLISENKLSRSIEVGCAMGISSLAICEAIKKNDPVQGQHIIVDPFQSTDWKNIGISNLKKAGFNNYRLYEQRSEFILPKLAEEGVKIDFGFIDGWHTFDHTLIDFFYLNRMLQPGGIVVIDDTGMAAVNSVIRFIHQYPAYAFVDSVKLRLTTSRNILENSKAVLRPFAKLFGKRLSAEIFSAKLLQSDKSLGLDSSMVAFRKISEDDRPWNWHKNF